MSKERDTHFQEFAKLLWNDLLAVQGGYIDIGNDGLDDDSKHIQVIAQRAYDLANHVLDEMNPIAHQYASSNDEILQDVPDMTALPEDSQPT